MRIEKILPTLLITGIILSGLIKSDNAYAQSSPQDISLETLYTNPEGQTLPEAIIFYNKLNQCENCLITINQIITTLKSNYSGQLHAYLIDIAHHPEYISAFKLTGPLNLVLVRISDGASFGYETITGLESKIDDLYSFQQLLIEKIDNFLSIQPEN